MNTTTDSKWYTFAGGVLLGSALVSGGAFLALKYSSSSIVESPEPREANKQTIKRRQTRQVCIYCVIIFNSLTYRKTLPSRHPYLSNCFFLPLSNAGRQVLWLAWASITTPLVVQTERTKLTHLLLVQKRMSITKCLIENTTLDSAIQPPLKKIDSQAYHLRPFPTHRHPLCAALAPIELQFQCLVI